MEIIKMKIVASIVPLSVKGIIFKKLTTRKLFYKAMYRIKACVLQISSL